MASQEVNFCLVPEVPFILEGQRGFLEALRERLEKHGHAVVVVAEGAGQDLIAELPTETDASGNKRLADIGTYLKQRILDHFARIQVPVDVKYFDPSYIIRVLEATHQPRTWG